MNILYLCADRGIPVRGHKGAAVHVRTMTSAFARAGHSVTLLTPRPGPEDGPTPEAALVDIPLPSLSANGLDKNIARERQSLAYNDVLFTAAKKLLDRRLFDLIYERYSLWSDVGARLAGDTGLPLVLEVNAPLRLEAARYRHLSNPRLAKQIEANQFTAARAITVVSTPLRKYTIEQGASPEKVHVLPNGVDPIHFHPAVRGGSVHSRYALRDRIIVGFVGRPRPWHDLDTLLQAIEKLHAADSRYHLLLVGQMPDGILERLAAYHLLEAVSLTGPIPHEQVPAHIAAMDVAVSPHLTQAESYFSPLKLFEYLACGVPTVAADVGQPSQLIQNGVTGYLYSPGDAGSLAERIHTLVENPAGARQVAWQGAVEVLTNHTWDKNAEKVLEWVYPQKATTGNKTGLELPILDRKLRQRLYRATRPDLARSLLAPHLPTFGKKGPERLKLVAAIEVLKYKPGRRCVLTYRLNGRTRQGDRPTRHQIIGKIFRDERGRRLHELQDSLWHHGFGPDSTDEIHVPRSLGYSPKMRMQLQEHAPGKTLNELVMERDITPLVPRAAQALAKLHSWPVPVPYNGSGSTAMRTYTLRDELTNLDRFTANLDQVRPGSSPEIHNLRNLLFAWADQLPPTPGLQPIHRDFYYSQLLFDNNRVTLIDFDLFAMGDPAIDVANFTAHLYFMALDLLSNWLALTNAADLFLDTYTQHHPPDDDFWQRYAFYQTATFYRLLNVVAPRPGLAHLFDTICEHTATALDVASPV